MINSFNFIKRSFRASRFFTCLVLIVVIIGAIKVWKAKLNFIQYSITGRFNAMLLCAICKIVNFHTTTSYEWTQHPGQLLDALNDTLYSLILTFPLASSRSIIPRWAGERALSSGRFPSGLKEKRFANIGKETRVNWLPPNSKPLAA